MNAELMTQTFKIHLENNFPNLKIGVYVSGQSSDNDLGYHLSKIALTRERSDRLVGLYSFEVYVSSTGHSSQEQLVDKLIEALETLDQSGLLCRASEITWEHQTSTPKATVVYMVRSIRQRESEVKMQSMDQKSLGIK
ncbi:hypothetical protein ACE41H_09850 [Paenibacillus enshidis]|uniref:DUF3168 domain-containing protein n=1 Tax=Paenibacillus enshidis TaxID=1458439 RepID=A0ABV5ASU5_9BACL